MNHSDIAALMKGAAPAIVDLVARTMLPLVDQVAALKAEIAELRNIDHAATVADLVADAVGKLPAPTPGKDADPEETRQMVADAVKAAVDALPAPEPGAPGVVDPDAVAAVVDEKLAAAVAALPPAEPGKSVTVDDVAPMLAELVLDAVALIPAAEPGKSVTADDVAPMLAELVDKAVAALPPAERGAPGMLPTVRAWTDDVHREGIVVTFGGATYQANKDTGKAPPHADWTCIAAAGEPGKNADEIEVRETYDPDGTYHRLNIVALNGNAFMARSDDPGPCPGPGWQVIAMRGKPGEARKGDPGPSVKGPPGPRVNEMSIDDQGMLTLKNADGSTVECDLYPVLAKIGG